MIQRGNEFVKAIDRGRLVQSDSLPRRQGDAGHTPDLLAQSGLRQSGQAVQPKTMSKLLKVSKVTKGEADSQISKCSWQHDV